MWHTPDGDRTLFGAEATLVKAAITGIVESIKEESSGYGDQLEYCITLFDELPDSQRLMLLERVATYLLTDTPTTLDLTAVNEAAVGVIFEHARTEIDREVASGRSAANKWRVIALAAYRECFADDDEADDESEFVPSVADCVDLQKWWELLESLANRILWDRDYELADTFLDAPPVESRTLKQMLGVDADYFAAAAPDIVDDRQFPQVYGRLDRLAGPDPPNRN
jgi:hypothetical protein